jgi:photosystem II stability/assembly factor-like uncharacterized protein
MKVFYGSALVAVIALVGVSSQVRLGVLKNAGPQRISPRPLGITTPWKFIGPRALHREFDFAGWMTALAVDPRNANVVYTGAAGGGVWKTTDGGVHWAPLTDGQPSLTVGSIALDPSAPDTVYVGTGFLEHGVQDLYWGAGVLKSSDGGTTWTHLPGPFAGPLSGDQGGANIISLAIHPANGQVLLAGVRGAGGTPSGVYRSIDGAASWTSVLTGGAGTAVLIDPTNGSVAYAALSLAGYRDNSGGKGNGVYRSADAGATWTSAAAGTLPMNNLGFTTIAIAPSNPLILYAGIANPFGSLVGLFKTTDGARSWTRLSNAPSYCGDACWRRNVIRVDPTNPNLVYAGGRIGGQDALYRTLDGGDSWNEVSANSSGRQLASDLTALAFSRDGAQLYVADDGGVFRTSNAQGAAPPRFDNLNSTLGVTSFSPGTLSIHPTDVTIGFGGPQEGSGARYSGNLAWQGVVCGDGAATVIDPQTPNTVYAACQPDAQAIYKTTSGGASFNAWSLAQAGIDISDRYAVFRPLTMDPSNPQRLYYGTFRVYQTTDGATAWTPISPDVAGAVSALSAIAVAPSDPDTVYVGATSRYNGISPFGSPATRRVSVTTSALAGRDAVWTNRSDGLPQRDVSDIAIDSADSRTAFVAFRGFSGFSGDTAGHLFKTSNGGVSWADISGNLPNVPVNAIVVDPELANTLYVATDTGVFVSTSGGELWSPLMDGLPRAMVTALKLHRNSRTLRAATLGRGMWDLQIPR